jgi:integrating conjugative element protein (TIGR03758 family)
MIGDSALSAFQAASGITADKMSLLIRTGLLTIAFLWSAWCVYGEIHRMRHHEIEESELTAKLFRILFIATLMTILVFVV